MEQKKPLNEKVFWSEWKRIGKLKSKSRHKLILESDVKQSIEEAYRSMPWAILTPLGKKAIEVAFKDSFGYDYESGFAICEENVGGKE